MQLKLAIGKDKNHDILHRVLDTRDTGLLACNWALAPLFQDQSFNKPGQKLLFGNAPVNEAPTDPVKHSQLHLKSEKLTVYTAAVYYEAQTH